LLDLAVSPTNVFFLGSTKFITEDTPYEKYQNMIMKQSLAFMIENILPNKHLYENTRMLLHELQDLTL
jgi:hypothetical protein